MESKNISSSLYLPRHFLLPRALCIAEPLNKASFSVLSETTNAIGTSLSHPDTRSTGFFFKLLIVPLPKAPRTTAAHTTRPARTQGTAGSEPCPRGDGSTASQACPADGPPAPTRSREAAPRRLRSRPQTRRPSRRRGAHLSRGAGQHSGSGPARPRRSSRPGLRAAAGSAAELAPPLGAVAAEMTSRSATATVGNRAPAPAYGH